MSIITIDDALDYLYSFINYEVDTSHSYSKLNYNVKRTIELLKYLHNPQDNFKVLHVAGTKGKGSVCMIMENLLRAMGFKTGLFLSPHIERVNERITVNGEEINDTDFIEIIKRLKPRIEKFPVNNRPTTFEILTAMAALYFAEMNIEYAIFETGMGGRFDSTNFVSPEVSVITPISYDHMDKLGNTIEKIAFEKAGIIKPETPVVIAPQKYPVYQIFKKRAEDLRSPYYEVEKLCSYSITKLSEKGAKFDVIIQNREINGLFTSLIGKHQIENILTVLLTMQIINRFPDENTLKRVLSRLNFKTRLEVIKKERLFLLDSAHNEESSRRISEALKDYFNYKRLVTIVGIVKGKDIKGILKNLASQSDLVIVTNPITHKELDTGSVYRITRTFTSNVILVPKIPEAINTAVKNTSENDLILITGSFYTTSPARMYLTKGSIPQKF